MSEHQDVLIHVTAEHIAKGIRRRCGLCPVALAASEAFGTAIEVGPVSMWTVGPEPDGTCPIKRMPPEVGSWISLFDDGGPRAVFPFSFFMPHPSTWTQRTH